MNMNTKKKTDDHVLPILNAAQQAAEQLKALRDKLSSDTRHSFRTPLTVIDGTARRIERHAEKMAPSEIRERVNTIRNSVERMVEIVERSIQMAELASCVRDVPENTSLVTDIVARLVDERKAARPDISLVAWTENCEDLKVSDRRLLELVLDKLFTLGEEIVSDRGRLDFVCWSDGCCAYLSFKAVFEVRGPVDLAELEARFDDNIENKLSLICAGMELKLIRLLIEQHAGELDVDMNHDFVEFDIQIPMETKDNLALTPLIYNETAKLEG